MSDEKPRLGGMALPNGVLVHGPTSWACAIRTGDGRLEVASGAKSIRSVDVRTPVLRGLARVAELLAVFPALRRALPEAQLPFSQARVAASMVGSAIVTRSLRSTRLSPLAQETAAAALAIAPVAMALRGSELAAYHGAEHITIGSYEHDEPRPREHERCGSHMLAPLLAATVVGNAIVAETASTPYGRTAGRIAASAGAVVVAGELMAWSLNNPEHPVSRALSRPGTELQRRFLTAEPTPAQLEVAEAALAECLRLERAAS